MVKPILLASATEIAYLQQCVELKRQLNEIEELNKTLHLSKARCIRSCMKSQLFERVLILDGLSRL